MTNRRLTIAVAVLAVIGVSVLGVLALTGGSSSAATGNGIDRAFAQQMVPHHRDAVAMAKLAEQNSKRPELQGVARDIISAQTAEISTLQAIDARLGADGVMPGKLDMGSDGGGMQMDGGAEMGKAMDPAQLSMAKPFDRAFIDAMVAHHQSAIVMARDVLARGSDSEVGTIAKAVVEAQSREITQLNQWRESWYGAMSPAGGVPAA